MADYATLKAAIQAVIYENGNQEITGSVMQATLLAMVNSLGANYQYAGIATPSTNPGTPDQNVFYIAGTAGTYVNFGNIVLTEGEVAILKYNGSWTKETSGFASAEGLSQLGKELKGRIEIPMRYPGAYLADAGGVGSTVAIYSPVFTSGWNCYMAPCSEGDTVIVNGTGGASPRLWAFVDADYKILEVAAASASASNLEKSAPANSAFVIINDKTNAKSYIVSQSNLTKLALHSKDQDEILQRLDAQSLETIGIDISFENKSYSSIPFGVVLPAGTVLHNNGYTGIIYLYNFYGQQYSWNPANKTYTTPEGITYFRPTNNNAGRITTEGMIKKLNDSQANNNAAIAEVRTDLGVYDVSIWGGQVDTNTGQLYNSAYNAFHFSEPIPVTSKDSRVFCSDAHVSRYMFYSAMPVIGPNSEIYLGNNATGIIPVGAKYAIVVFENTYVPSVQPFYFYTDQFALDVFFSKKMKGKKLVTLGDSLVQICAWQPRLSNFSGLVWSYDETYTGVGYVSLIDGTYTTEDKSADPNYRAAYKMGYGGSSIRPASENSAYIRSKDAKFYNPDVIIIWAGENDGIEDWKSSGNTGTTPDEIVAQEIPYKNGVVDNTVSTIAAYKGMIEQLMENNPNVIIFLVTSMRAFGEIGKNPTGVYENVYPHPRFADMQDVLEWESSRRYPKVEYTRAIARYYSLPIIDLWAKSGINDYNAGVWYGESADNCIQVHPLQVGYNRVADVMLQCI